MGKKKDAKRLARRVAALIMDGSVDRGSPPKPSGLSRDNGSQGAVPGHQTATSGTPGAVGSAFSPAWYSDAVADAAAGQADAGLDPMGDGKASSAMLYKSQHIADPYLARGYRTLADNAARVERTPAERRQKAADYRAKAAQCTDRTLFRGFMALADQEEGL